jgi:hypothetical protein
MVMVDEFAEVFCVGDFDVMALPVFEFFDYKG